jgi:hypothetical protein
VGTTFSQLQCRYMGLDYQQVFREICKLGCKRIRLCSYWNEIESVENQLDFTRLDWLLEQSDRAGIEVILTVGMKAPRWPEFHFPDWLQARYDTGGHPEPIDRIAPIADRGLRFTQAVVNHTRQAPAVKYWQVENEPFTRLDITAGRFLSYGFVQKEVELVRSLMLPGQKLALTNAISLPQANLREDDRAFEASLSLADAVGINVYTRVPAGNSPFYLQPFPIYWRRLQNWRQQLVAHDREDWIAEAQAEPWEPGHLVAMHRLEHPSSSPRQAAQLVSTLTKLGYSTVMLWGCEYWYWQRQQGAEAWWLGMQKLIQA